MNETLEQRVCALLWADGPLRCATIGERLWGSQFRQPQHYCRPAGKLLRRIKAAGLVRQTACLGYHAWMFVRSPNKVL